MIRRAQRKAPRFLLNDHINRDSLNIHEKWLGAQLMRSPLRILRLILFKYQANVKPMCLCVASRNRDGTSSHCVIKYPNCVVEKTVRRTLGGHGIFLCRIRSPNGPFGKRSLQEPNCFPVVRFRNHKLGHADVNHHGFGDTP